MYIGFALVQLRKNCVLLLHNKPRCANVPWRTKAVKWGIDGTNFRIAAQNCRMSAAQSYQISLETSGFVRPFQLEIDLVQVAADSQQDAARAHGSQRIFAQAVIALDQILDAVGFRHELAAVKRVDVNLSGGGLVTANEVPGQTDPGHWQPQPAGEENVEQGQINGVSGATIQNAI